MNHVFNVKKDTVDNRDHYAMRMGIEVRLPSSVDLSNFLGPVKDQTTTSSCTAHAGSTIREFLYRQFYKYEKDQTVPAIQIMLSPMFLYAQERIIEGDFPSDNGAQSRTVMQAISKFGICLESRDIDIAKNVTIRPTQVMYDEAIKYSNTSYHRVMDVDTARSVLASGYVCSLGMPVYESFESDQVAKDGKVPIPAANERCLGGHEVVIFGYDDNYVNLDGTKGVFKVRNSWNSSWADHGNFYLPYSYLLKYQEDIDIWTMHLSKPW